MEQLCKIANAGYAHAHSDSNIKYCLQKYSKFAAEKKLFYSGAYHVELEYTRIASLTRYATAYTLLGLDCRLFASTLSFGI